MVGGVVDLVASNGQREREVCLFVEGEDSTLRYLKSGLVCIVYLESEFVVSECLEMKDKIFDDLAFRFNVVFAAAGVV